MAQPLLRATNLSISFTREKEIIPAVQGANVDIMRGEVVAIVGESGSGKSTLAMSLLGLLAGNGEVVGGSIEFDGRDMLSAREADWLGIRGARIGMVPQDPMSNLNPMKRVRDQLGEVLLRHGRATRKNLEAECCRVLERAGISDPLSRLDQFPHQLSGGLRQRVLIAIGTACDPELLIADEPTSALDVTVSSRILDQIAEISKRMSMSVLLITHDLGLAAERADRVIVMKHGRVVEAGSASEILSSPREAYTQQLVAADPGIRARTGKSIVTRREIDETEVVIEIEQLNKTFRRRRRDTPVVANKNVSLSVPKGSTVALVGESGSGKTTVSRVLLQLEKPTTGSVAFDGQDIQKLSREQQADYRRRVQPIFQDPYSSLNPMMTVRSIIREGMDLHKIGSRAERNERVKLLLQQVDLAPELAKRHPAELSGGQRQRVAIARAISMKPEVLVCDEPVSALDVLVQQQVLQLLRELQLEQGLTYLFITHDLAVVKEFADYVYVMRAGSIVEQGLSHEIFTNPREDYTKQLLAAARMT